jgi:NADPH:quinone reductase-like Zn-dependent oxidoreductase
MPTIEELIASGAIGGRTAQIVEGGAVVCETYEAAPLPPDHVRVRTVRSAISPGTEMTYYGPSATNVYLNKRWNPELRLFEPGPRTLEYPVTFGYRAAGAVTESRSESVPVGTRIYGNWRHTELVAMQADQARAQVLPDSLSYDDGVDLAQMGPICVNAVAFGERAEQDHPAVVFGAGPVGLITAQVVRASGAEPVYVVDRTAARLELATDLGLDAMPATRDVARTLKERHGSEGIPVAWECTGSTNALNEAIRVVRRQGTVVAVGFYQGEATGLQLGDEFHHNGVRIVSGQIGNVHSDFDMHLLRSRTIDLASSGRLILGGLQRALVPIEDIDLGFEMIGRQEVLQVTLTY